MVKFKVLKYKHYLKAVEMTKKVDAGKVSQEESIQYVLSMVMEWDFVDVETGDPLIVGSESLGELSLEQMNEMTELFNLRMTTKNTVPKASAGHLLSSSTELNQEPKTQETVLSGFPPSS